jgi:hypothetical protein
MSMSCLVVTCGAWVFTWFEETWQFIDSVYYCVITLTTVGFGDFVALQRENDLQHLDYVAFSIFFILFGLGVVSAAMNLLVLRFLTMNTEDERRDEQLAALRRSVIQLDAASGRLLSVGASTVNGAASISSLHRLVVDAATAGGRVGRSGGSLPAQLSLQLYNELSSHSERFHLPSTSPSGLTGRQLALPLASPPPTVRNRIRKRRRRRRQQRRRQLLFAFLVAFPVHRSI